MRVSIEFDDGRKVTITNVGSINIDATGRIVADSWLDVDELSGEPLTSLDNPIPYALTECDDERITLPSKREV